MNDLVSAPWSPSRPTNHLDRSSALFDAFGRLRVSGIDTIFDSGYASRDNRQSSESIAPSIQPGVSIAGTSDIVALGIESIGGTSTCSAGLGLRQLV